MTGGRTGWYGWATRAAGVAVLGAVLWKVDITKVAQAISSANMFWLALTCVLVIPFIAIKAIRWRMLLSAYGVHVSFTEAWKLYAIGISAGTYTPGQAGDAVKAWYLRERGSGLVPPLASAAVDRLMDLLALICFAIAGVMVFWELFHAEVFLLAIAMAATLALTLVALNRRARMFSARIVVKLVISGRLRQALGGSDVTEKLENLHLPASALLFGAGLTVLSFAMSFFRVYLLYRSLGIDTIGPLEVVATGAIATIGGLMFIGGVGSRDLALIWIFHELGYPQDLAVGLSTLILFMNFFGFLVGYTVWWRTSGRFRLQPAE